MKKYIRPTLIIGYYQGKENFLLDKYDSFDASSIGLGTELDPDIDD